MTELPDDLRDAYEVLASGTAQILPAAGRGGGKPRLLQPAAQRAAAGQGDARVQVGQHDADPVGPPARVELAAAADLAD